MGERERRDTGRVEPIRAPEQHARAVERVGAEVTVEVGAGETSAEVEPRPEPTAARCHLAPAPAVGIAQPDDADQLVGVGVSVVVARERDAGRQGRPSSRRAAIASADDGASPRPAITANATTIRVLRASLLGRADGLTLVCGAPSRSQTQGRGPEPVRSGRKDEPPSPIGGAGGVRGAWDGGQLRGGRQLAAVRADDVAARPGAPDPESSPLAPISRVSVVAEVRTTPRAPPNSS